MTVTEPLNVVFMGSPAFAVPCLETLAQTERVNAVVTQPDKPKGRGLELEAPAVKRAALRHGLTVWQPASLRKGPFVEELRALAPDLVVVVAYGKILPPDVLAVPRFGCWNVHASLLPKYRGAAPIQWAIISGERETGVTLMQMDAGLDTGPMLLRRTLPIDRDVTAGELHERMAPLGAALLHEGLERLRRGGLDPEPQDPTRATLAPLLTKESGRVDLATFAEGAERVCDRVRGCDPWPSAFTLLDGEPLKLFRPRRVAQPGAVGEVLSAALDAELGLVVGCGDDAVAFAELQLPGRRRMSAAALVSGRAIPAGTRLGA